MKSEKETKILFFLFDICRTEKIENVQKLLYIPFNQYYNTSVISNKV